MKLGLCSRTCCEALKYFLRRTSQNYLRQILLAISRHQSQLICWTSSKRRLPHHTTPVWLMQILAHDDHAEQQPRTIHHKAARGTQWLVVIQLEKTMKLTSSSIAAEVEKYDNPCRSGWPNSPCASDISTRGSPGHHDEYLVASAAFGARSPEERIFEAKQDGHVLDRTIHAKASTKSVQVHGICRSKKSRSARAISEEVFLFPIIRGAHTPSAPDARCSTQISSGQDNARRGQKLAKQFFRPTTIEAEFNINKRSVDTLGDNRKEADLSLDEFPSPPRPSLASEKSTADSRHCHHKRSY